MSKVAPIYSREQREAVAAAYADPTATATHVQELASVGALLHPDGTALPPFAIPASSIRSIARRESARDAANRGEPNVVDLPHRDAVERFRQRLAQAISDQLDALERDQAAGRAVNLEKVRQLCRALRELASVPGPSDPPPPAPGAKVNGVRNGAETRGGLAGRILADLRNA